jgi:hypothetical protein
MLTPLKQREHGTPDYQIRNAQVMPVLTIPPAIKDYRMRPSSIQQLDLRMAKS